MLDVGCGILVVCSFSFHSFSSARRATNLLARPRWSISPKVRQPGQPRKSVAAGDIAARGKRLCETSTNDRHLLITASIQEPAPHIHQAMLSRLRPVQY